MCIKNNRRSGGFTLLEMLIAVAIFAMLGVAANSVLSTVMRNDEVTSDFAKRLKSLQQGFGAIERDLGQIVARTPRLLDGSRDNGVFQYGTNILDSESESLVFFRLGWLNPAGILPRGTLQSVAYVVQEGRLERWYYPYPEPDSGAEPLKNVIIDKVLSVEYAFFSGDKWQKQVANTQLPQGIAIKVEVEGLGVIERKFLLPKGAAAVGSSSGSANNPNNPSDPNDPNNVNNGQQTQPGTGQPDVRRDYGDEDERKRE
ncbi:type II secretion system minor pseudopilin GspJ [Shewanella sp.]|uniref:type II secretion system minor pseudopilin GspJ n=1 Tax=Shewanella sp. TaxID=50422 RepID=UPI0040542DAA